MIWVIIIGVVLLVLGDLTRTGNMDPLTTKIGSLGVWLSYIVFTVLIIVSIIGVFVD